LSACPFRIAETLHNPAIRADTPFASPSYRCAMNSALKACADGRPNATRGDHDRHAAGAVARIETELQDALGSDDYEEHGLAFFRSQASRQGSALVGRRRRIQFRFADGILCDRRLSSALGALAWVYPRLTPYGRCREGCVGVEAINAVHASSSGFGKNSPMIAEAALDFDGTARICSPSAQPRYRAGTLVHTERLITKNTKELPLRPGSNHD
jgi:hypothetical protein